MMHGETRHLWGSCKPPPFFAFTISLYIPVRNIRRRRQAKIYEYVTHRTLEYRHS